MSAPNSSQPINTCSNNSVPTHHASYTKNKTTGEYLIRLVGPDSAYASGETIPVATKTGEVHMETLGELVHVGVDDWVGPGYEPSGLPLALYRFDRKPRQPAEKKPFKM